MCVVSMVMDHYWEKWAPTITITGPDTNFPNPFIPSMPSPAEIAEFRDLLQRARKYDIEHNEPDCELAEKRQKLLDLADELGIDISFVNGTSD